MAIDKSKKMMGVGVIVRDSEYNVMAAMCTYLRYINNIIDPTMAEAYVTRKAVLFGRDLGL